MNAIRRDQRGASLWLVMLVVIILGFGFIFGLKLIPIYLEWYKVEKAVNGALQAGAESQDTLAIKRAIVRRLDIDDVRRITEANFNEFAKISKRGSRVTVDMEYDRIEPLFANVSILVHFDKSFTN